MKSISIPKHGAPKVLLFAIGAILLLAGGLVVIWGAFSYQSSGAVRVPDRDWSGVEPQVAAKIRDARQKVLDNPQSAETWGRLGIVFHAHAFTAEAQTCYHRSAELDPTDHRWPYLAALANLTLDHGKALSLFRQAEPLDPPHAAFYVQYGKALMDSDEIDKARLRFERALQIDPECAQALVGLGQVALREDDLRASRAYLERSAELDPSNRETFTLLATVYHRLGDTERARIAALRADSLPTATKAPDPDFGEVEDAAVSARAYGARGRRLGALGQYEEAVRAYEKILEIRSDQARDYSNLGAALAGLQRHEQAIEAFKKALELHPDEAFAHCNLGLVYGRMGRYDLALKHLNEALRLQPSYAEAHYNLGFVRSRQRMSEAAVEHYREALRLNSAFVVAHVSLGEEMFKSGLYAEAVEHWERALDIAPYNLDALYRLGTTLAMLGRYERSIDVLKEGIELAPNSSLMGNALAWVLATCPEAELRDGAEAVRLATHVCEGKSFQDPPSLDVLAAALAEFGRFDQAIQIAQHAIALAEQRGHAELAANIKARLGLYRRGLAYHQISESEN